MSIGALDEPPGLAWTPRVDAAWFAEVVPGFEGAARAAATVPAEQSVPPARQITRQMTWQSRSIDAIADQWVIQLTPQAGRLAGSVAGVSDLLQTDRFQTQLIRGLGLEGMALLQTSPGTDPQAVEAWLGSHPLVAYAEPNAVLHTEALPNDRQFSELWGLHNTGQTGGVPDADIDAPEAWELTTGSASIVVGVIDTGVDYTHPDLAANIWTNPGEIPGNRVDDDGNGFVDDVHGYDFVDGDGNPMDDNGHGTHVAGTIAGAGNDGRGVTGVNWTGSVMALKFLDAGGSGTTSDAVAALNYATMMRSVYGVNVRVTSNSWGGGGYSQALYDAIRAGGEAGVLFVAAAGNDGTNNDLSPHYPSNYDLESVIAVAATNHYDRLASFSNYGPASVDLAAPGVDVYSTVPGSDYDWYSGTSMATPHVAGTAALAWSATPNATVRQIRDALLGGTDPITSLGGKMVTGGRLNARNCLEGLSISVATSDPAMGSVISTAPLEFTVRFTHAYDPATVDAADLLVNGIAAGGVTLVDGDTVRFHFETSPVADEGPQGMEIREGAILRFGDGDPIGAWQAGFHYDLLPMAVIATAPAEGEVLRTPPSQIVLDFNEPVDRGSVDRDDLTLNTGGVIAAMLVGSDSVAYTVSGLPGDGRVSYVLAEGAIRDLHGAPGPTYSGQFTIDDPLIDRHESVDGPRWIFDYETTISTLTIGESFGIADLDVQLDITHEYDADLDVYLVAPDGTRIELFTDAGGSGQDFAGTILDDEAVIPITFGSAPFAGRYRPEGRLSAVDNLDAMGTWTLRVSDDGGLDMGTLNGWAMILRRGREFPPRIVAIEPLPADGGQTWSPRDGLEVRFSKPMDAASVNDTNHWQLLQAGADGAFDTTDDVDFRLSVSPPYADGLTATLEIGGGGLPPGSYRFTAAGGGLADTLGNSLDGDGDHFGGDDFRTHFTILPGQRYAAGDTPKNIVDHQTIRSTLTVDESFPIADLDVEIDVTHPWDSDLDVYLVAPDGTRIELFTDAGGSGNNFSGTILDDEAALPIVFGRAPFTGRYRPEGRLSAVDGLSALGTWTLEVSDDGWLDEGTLNGWAIIAERAAIVPPRIVGHAPDGLVLGPVDSLRLDFDRPMDPGSFSPADDVLSFLGPQGPILPTGHHWVDPQTLEVTFEPQRAAGRVAMLVGPQILDTAGTALDRDGDSVPGEVPDDQYLAGFSLARPLGSVGFLELSGLDPSAGDLWYRLETTRRGTLTVEAIVPGAAGAAALALYGEARNDPPLTVSSPVGGNQRIDWQAEAGGETYWLKLTGTGTDVDLRLANLLEHEGGTVTVFGTEGDDRFFFDAAGSHRIAINGVQYEFDSAAVSRVTFDGGEGEDTATLTGSPGDDEVRVYPGAAVFSGAGFDVGVSDAARITVHGGGGSDVAFLYDSAGDDTFTATPGEAALSGEGYCNEAAGFGVVHGIARYGGFDTARLDDSSGDDRFVARPTYAKLAGEGFYSRAKWFDEVGAYAIAGGEDRAFLFGSPQDDTFTAIPAEGRFAGPGFSNAACSFEAVEAIATGGGHDEAVFYDSAGDDLFVGRPGLGKLRGEGFQNRGKLFDAVRAVATAGGADVAHLFDSPGNDTFVASPGMARLDGSGFQTVAEGFGSVHAYATAGGYDTAHLYDSPGDDALVATPIKGTLSGENFSSRAVRFDSLRAYAYAGGYDVADLYDSAGDDVFVGKPDFSKLSGAGFLRRANAFDAVYAHALAGGHDRAYLYDSALDDLLEAGDGWARLSSNNDPLDFLYEVLAFETVQASSSTGHDVKQVAPEVDFLDLAGPWLDRV